MPGFDSCLEPAPAPSLGPASVPYRESLAVPSHWSEWFTAKRFAALLGVLIAANFAAILCGFQTFFLRDFGYFSYPIAHYHRECFWRGEIPLWNPYNSCGLPFLAQWNTLVLYPPSLIYLLLPMPWSFNLFCLVHLFIGGLGMYFLAQRWVENRFAASVAGMLFAFSGFSLNCLMWSNNIAALALLPWLVLCAERAWRNGGRQLCLAALVGTLQMLSGAPEIIFLTWLFIGCVWLLDVFSAVSKLRALLRLGAVVAIVAGLSAAQLLPFLDLLRASDRGAQFATAAWSMPAMGWANFFVPLFHSYPTPSGVFFQHDQYWVASYYLGVCGMALAIIAALHARHARVWLLLGLSALGVGLAFGDNAFLYPAFRKLAPQLGFMRFPIKFIVLFALALPLLAAFGVRWLQQNPDGKSVRRTLAGTTVFFTVTLVGIVWFARVHPGASEDWHTTLWSGGSRWLVVLGLMALLWSLGKVTRNRTGHILGLLALVLIFLDARTHSSKTNPTLAAAAMHSGFLKLDPAPGLEGNRAMLTRPAYDEVHSKMISDPLQDFLLHRQVLFDNCNLVDGIPKIDGFFSLYLAEQRHIWAELRFNQTNLFDAPLLDFLGVAHVNTPGAIFDWTNRASALPVATIGQQPQFADASATLDGLIAPSFNPRRTVYLPPDAEASVSISQPTDARITSQKFTAQRIGFRVEAKESSLLVLAQTFDRSWRARVDGVSTTVLRANHAFQAVVVPAGAHDVVFTYESQAFRMGVIVTLCTLMLASTLWFLRPRWL
jgi:hypothetical protein